MTTRSLTPIASAVVSVSRRYADVFYTSRLLRGRRFTSRLRASRPPSLPGGLAREVYPACRAEDIVDGLGPIH